ncbi:pyridoxal phosphate-dependent transferase [Lipomyces chichibuensis]|uniref:pyridoxal phosphate-dependent transferase n=1 Tax=Lipomyces chichibuensis TaxID=1546026 RepID=UPI003343A493
MWAPGREARRTLCHYSRITTCESGLGVRCTSRATSTHCGSSSKSILQSFRSYLSRSSKDFNEEKTMSLAVGRINLVRGWPAPDLLPVHQLSDADQRVLSDPSIYEPALHYGDDPGYRPLREALPDWLSTHYNVTRDPDRICISGGASQNIACILQSFTDPAYTRAIWMVAPCYYLACTIFRDAGFEGRIRGFPEDEEGIDLVELEEGIKTVDEQQQAVISPKLFKDAGRYHKFYRHVIYVMPLAILPARRCLFAGEKIL